MDEDQLRIGHQPTPEPAGEWFKSDHELAMLLLDLEAVYRGALAKLAAVRRFLQHDQPDPEPDPNLMRLALEHLADPDNWVDGRLRGPHTPFEMAATALGRL
jgi:hypothetical protein